MAVYITARRTARPLCAGYCILLTTYIFIKPLGWMDSFLMRHHGFAYRLDAPALAAALFHPILPRRLISSRMFYSGWQVSPCRHPRRESRTYQWILDSPPKLPVLAGWRKDLHAGEVGHDYVFWGPSRLVQVRVPSS